AWSPSVPYRRTTLRMTACIARRCSGKPARTEHMQGSIPHSEQSAMARLQLSDPRLHHKPALPDGIPPAERLPGLGAPVDGVGKRPRRPALLPLDPGQIVPQLRKGWGHGGKDVTHD